MEPSRRKVPAVVLALCAIVILLPLFEGAVRVVQAHGYVSPRHKMPSVWSWAAIFVIHVLFASGLARGVNWVRLVFVAICSAGLLLEIIALNQFGPILIGSPPPLPLYAGLIEWFGYLTAVILCRASTVNAYFRSKRSQNQSPDRTAPRDTPRPSTSANTTAEKDARVEPAAGRDAP